MQRSVLSRAYCTCACVHLLVTLPWLRWLSRVFLLCGFVLVGCGAQGKRAGPAYEWQWVTAGGQMKRMTRMRQRSQGRALRRSSLLRR
jgi:hypothetical protein